MRLHGDGGLQFSVTKNFDWTLSADHARLAQDFGSNRSLAQRYKLFQVHDVVFLAEDVSKAALRQTAVQRHLAAFKSAHHARTAAGALALVSTGRGLAHAGTHTAANALLVLRRLLRCSNVRKIHISNSCRDVACNV